MKISRKILLFVPILALCAPVPAADPVSRELYDLVQQARAEAGVGDRPPPTIGF